MSVFFSENPPSEPVPLRPSLHRLLYTPFFNLDLLHHSPP
jgi:hypothetical protein